MVRRENENHLTPLLKLNAWRPCSSLRRKKKERKKVSVQNEPLCGFGCENDEIYRLCMFLRMHFRGRVEGGIGRGKELYYDMRHHENLISLG